MKFLKEQIENEKRHWVKELDVALNGIIEQKDVNLFLRKKGTDLFKESE
jgi:hypothetical protein